MCGQSLSGGTRTDLANIEVHGLSSDAGAAIGRRGRLRAEVQKLTEVGCPRSEIGGLKQAPKYEIRSSKSEIGGPTWEIGGLRAEVWAVSSLAITQIFLDICVTEISATVP